MTPCREASFRSISTAPTQGQANFGFNYTCEMNAANKAVIKGEITYHDSPSTINFLGDVMPTPFPEIRIHGTVKPIVILSVESARRRRGSCSTAFRRPSSRAPTGPRTRRLAPLEGEFTVLVGDQGEPGHPRGDFTGDLFSIELFFGPYNGYTRGGYIEGGNIQVD